MSKTLVQRAFRYRFYPTEGQAVELSRTFGCVRLIYNRALAARTTAWREEQRRIGYAETSALLTGWKRTADLAFLNDVSCVPLQQGLRHRQAAFTNRFDKRAKYPRFRSRKRSRCSAEYTRSGFRSKTCSRCGWVKTAMSLRERVFHCDRCGLVLDRDVNAARTVVAAGRAVTACGAGVRPSRR